MRKFKSYGTGEPKNTQNFSHWGDSVIIEDGVRLFHVENMHFDNNIYIGHDTYIHAYHKGKIKIFNNVWIGPKCYMHGAGEITIEKNVGIGAGVKLLTSAHDIENKNIDILDAKLIFKPIHIKEGADIGVNTVILPGVTIGKGVQVGAGSIVSRNVDDYAVVAGNPAKVLRYRT